MRVTGRRYIIIIFVIGALALSACGAEINRSQNANMVDSVTLTNKGSDTIVNLALAWAEAYHVTYPNISVSVTGGGSGTGIAAMINGTVDIANASRRMKEKEVANAKENGFVPVE